MPLHLERHDAQVLCNALEMNGGRSQRTKGGVEGESGKDPTGGYREKRPRGLQRKRRMRSSLKRDKQTDS